MEEKAQNCHFYLQKTHFQVHFAWKLRMHEKAYGQIQIQTLILAAGAAKTWPGQVGGGGFGEVVAGG